MKNRTRKPRPLPGRHDFSSFEPPCCPHADCPSNGSDEPFKFHRHGSYRRAVDGLEPPRFLCLACRRTCSSQTFRADYRLQNPRRYRIHFEYLISKVTLRQICRITGSKLDTVARHQRSLGDHLRRLLQSVMIRAAEGERIPPALTLVFDELETFESDRICKPVTAAVVVEARTGFVVECEVGALPPRRRRGRRSHVRAVEADGERPRRSGSRRAVRAALRRAARWLGPECRVSAISDRKSTYPAALQRAFGCRLVGHRRIDSRAQRSSANPLFPVNLTLAMMRDGLSRLVRRTWAHSKKRGRLRQHLYVWMAWRNLIRPRTARSGAETPAMALGVTNRPWSVERLLGWHGRFTSLVRLG